MIASQFILDDRLAELRQATPDSRTAQARAVSSRQDGAAVRSLIDAIRSLLGGSTAANRTLGAVTH